MKRLELLSVILLIAINLNAQTSGNPDSSTVTGPGSYQKLTGDASISIPFKMHNGKPLMELEINGKKAALMIDNGILWDQVWLLGSPLVGELDLKPVEESSIEGAGEGDPTQAYTSTNLTLKFPNIVFYEQPVMVSPPAAGFARAFPGTDGQLCNTFFRHFIVEFDFVNNKIILHEPDKFKYSGRGSVLDMRLNESGTYSIPFTFTMRDGKTYADRVDIDLGGIYALKIALNNRNNIQVPADAEATFSYGTQGRTSEYKGKIKSMTIGKYKFSDVTAVFGDEKTSRVHPDNLGVVGLPLFMKFNIIFDYFNNKIYIEPNKYYKTPFD